MITVLKPVLKNWLQFGTTKTNKIVLNQFLFFIDIDPISTRFWCESYLWPYIDNVLRVQCFGLFRNYNLFKNLNIVSKQSSDYYIGVDFMEHNQKVQLTKGLQERLVLQKVCNTSELNVNKWNKWNATLK